MYKGLICIQCGIETNILYLDPRTPPLDEYKCLCEECLEYANEESES